MIKIIDTHCDALLKLWEDKTRTFFDSKEIDTNYLRLKRGNIYIQCFAIFIEPFVENKFQAVLEQIDLFQTKIIQKHSKMKHIKNWDEIRSLKEGEIGAILTLEGVEAIGADLVKLRILYELGVLSVGLTWNYGNLAADGVLEKRGASLSKLGKEIVALNNQYLVFTDVSHLHENGFWDVLELAKYPIASHSNAKTLCNHPRNLTDEQITALFQKGGFISIVFYPDFLSDTKNATMDDIIRHIDYICNLGGKDHICLGSDFDGIPYAVKGLMHAGDYQNLINELQKRFSEEEVTRFAYKNFLSHLPKL